MKRVILLVLVGLIVMIATTAQDETGAPLEPHLSSDGRTLRVQRIEFRTGIEDQGEANQGMLAIFTGTFYRVTSTDECVLARDIRLILDGEEYPPDRGWMADYQGTLTQHVDYPGPIGGHCFDEYAETRTFFVFDTPPGAETVALRFLDETVTLAIDWPTDTENLAAVNFVQPTATLTNTRRATLTSRPSSTPRATVAATIDPLVSEIMAVEGVVDTRVTTGIFVQLEVVVYPDYLTQETADVLREIVAAADYNTEELSIIFADGILPIEYLWRDGEWIVTELPQVATAIATLLGTPTPLRQVDE